jgi:hypothetical protein
VNPGSHAIVVKLASVERKQDVSVVERENKVVNVDVKPPVKTAVVRTPPPVVTSESSTPRILMYGGFAAGAVGLTVGAITGLMSISKTNDLKGACPNNACPQTRQSDLDSATSYGNVSTVAFIVTGIAVGVGIVGLVMSSGEKPSSTSTASNVLTGRF